jgi:CHAT domain-containing protein
MEDVLRQLLGSPLDGEAAARMSLLETLFSTMARDPKSVAELLDRMANRLTPELAEDARQVYTRAMDTQQYSLARVAITLAYKIYLRLGDHYEAQQSYMYFLEYQYFVASTLEEHNEVQQDIDRFIQVAKELKAPDLISQGYLISANCRFFSAPLAQEHRVKTNLLLNTLADLLNASEYKTEPRRSERWLDQFVSLLSTLFTRIEDDEEGIISDITHSQKEAEITRSSDRFLKGEEVTAFKDRVFGRIRLPDRWRNMIKGIMSSGFLENRSQKTIPERVVIGEEKEDTKDDQALAEARAAFNTTLQQVAQMAERLIPVNFMAQEGLGKSIYEAGRLARLSHRFGIVEIANERLAIAIDRAEQFIEQSGDYEILMNTVFPLYTVARDTGSSITKLAKLRRVLRTSSEKYRRQFLSRSGRLWVAQELDDFFGLLLEDELKQLQDEIKEKGFGTLNYFNSIEPAKARALLDQMSVEFKELPTKELNEQVMLMERQLLGFAPEPEDLLDTPKKRLRHKETLIVTRLPVGLYWSINQAISDEVDLDKNRRLKLLASIEEKYRTHQAGFTGVQNISQDEEIRQALQPDEVFIEYGIPFRLLHPSYTLVILVITKDQKLGIHFALDQIPGWKDAHSLQIGEESPDGILWRQPQSSNLLADLVVGARVAIQQQDLVAAYYHLNMFYKILIRPIIDSNIQLQGHKCIIVPHGMLHQIPFTAILSDAGRHMIEDTSITIAPSASTWLKQREQSRPDVTSFLGFANPDLPYTQLSPLPYSEKELVRICKSLASLHCTTYTHAQATEEVFLAQAVGKNIIHLATHGDFPEQNAIDLHRILLAPTAAHDGQVNAEEIRSMHLQAARLVVLSICDGGLYRIGPGDEPYGLISALLIAGVENVIGPLWPLKDDMGYFFMIEFYKHLLKAGPAEALQQTCKTFIQDRASLRDWAGIIMVGSGKRWTETHH